MQSGNRTLIVGIFVVVGIIFLGWMTVSFKGGSGLAIFRGGYRVALTFTSLDGAGDGTEIRLNGRKIGSVLRTEIDPDAARPPRMIAEIEPAYRIPRGARGRLLSETFGRRYVDFVFAPPADGKIEYWPTDGTAVIPGHVSPSPYEQLGDAVDQVGKSVRVLEAKTAATLEKATEVLISMNRLVDENRRGVQMSIDAFSKIVGSEDNQKNISRALAFLGDEKLHSDLRDSATGLRRIAADPKLAEDVKAVVKELRTASADIREITGKAREWSGGVDRIVGKVEKAVDGFDRTISDIGGAVQRVALKLQDDLEHLEKILRPLEAVAREIEGGKGTVGRLFADARLYEAMVDLVALLKMTGEDVRKVIKKWDEGGLKLNIF